MLFLFFFFQSQAEDRGVDRILQEIDFSPLYYTRTRGLFRECFPGEKSNAPQGDLVELYMSPVETWCHNINYYIPDEEGETKNFNMEMMARIHMGRAMIALFITAFFFMFVSFITGVVGCWRTSPSNINGSAILMLIACKCRPISRVINPSDEGENSVETMKASLMTLLRRRTKGPGKFSRPTLIA